MNIHQRIIFELRINEDIETFTSYDFVYGIMKGYYWGVNIGPRLNELKNSGYIEIIGNIIINGNLYYNYQLTEKGLKSPIDSIKNKYYNENQLTLFNDGIY